jgi:GNAT superfamily N-acetyltransferase
MTPDGPVAGTGYLVLEGDQPADMAAIDVTIRPDFRRRGLGTALLRAITMAASARQCLLIEGLEEGSAGQAWAASLGFTVVQRTVLLSLGLTGAGAVRWQVPAPAGYRLVQWTGSTPSDLLASYAAARDAMREAPHGDLSFTEPAWTPDRIRDEEATAKARECELRVAVAVHEPTAQIAGLTCLEVCRSRPSVAVQQDTVVLAAHRGHGLGAWIKAANLRSLTADHPAITLVTTSNAAENEHMLRINEQLGFTVAARTELREANVSSLLTRLGLASHAAR